MGRIKQVGGLAQAERRVLERAASGYTDDEIADFLGVEPSAVRMSFSRIYTKLGIAAEHRPTGRPGRPGARREALRQYFTGEAFDER